ncbi:MAG: phosphohistidine phosphatase SixA [Chitinivibrionales bacterium]|nr:phosphohistidine phosphatase SixA [Chitinivibrionales bacterium]MBD3396286.1 phosphohistidine phosphatase SixA [Chitinivibrionales bacterium]
MILYVVRHGIAVDIGEEGVATDARRHLSLKGKKKTAEAVRGLKHLGFAPSKVVSSPLARARQTAEIIVRAAPGVKRVTLNDALCPGQDAGGVVRWIARQKTPSLAVVGHMPDLGDLISALVAGSGDVGLVFKKAAVCCISFHGKPGFDAGRLEWLLQPGHLRTIAGL